MALRVSWDNEAENNLEAITEFILNNWNEKILVSLFKELNESIEQIQKFPESFAESNIKKEIRKCVVNKQISMYYSITKSEIEIRALIDNRQDNNKLKL